jgi:hypothetical protein
VQGTTEFKYSIAGLLGTARLQKKELDLRSNDKEIIIALMKVLTNQLTALHNSVTLFEIIRGLTLIWCQNKLAR